MNLDDPTNDRPQEYTSWGRDQWMFGEGGLVMLMYHKIARATLGTNLPALYVTAQDFDRQMAELAKAGVVSCAYSDVPEAVTRDENRFCLTFDDGFCNVFENALPVLRARSLRAIMFIVAGQIGGTDAWDRAIGEPSLPLMDDAQIRDWLAAGQEIGSHTLSHPRLSTLPREQARAEVFESKQRLEDRFGVPIRHFCYPYGAYNEAVRDLVAEAGYETAPTVHFGTNRPGGNLLELNRIMACDAPSPVRKVARRVARLARRAGLSR